MTFRRGDKVRVRSSAHDSGRTGTVQRVSEWYGRPVATVRFDDSRWDQSDWDDFYFSQLEKVKTESPLD